MDRCPEHPARQSDSSPASSCIIFPTSVNYSGHTGGISSSCLFQRALKDPQTDWKHGSAFQSEKKNPFSFWKWSYGWVLPSLKANAKQCIWGKDDNHTERMPNQSLWSQKSVEEARRAHPKASTPDWAQQIICSVLLAPVTDITPIMCYHQKMLGRLP